MEVKRSKRLYIPVPIIKVTKQKETTSRVFTQSLYKGILDFTKVNYRKPHLIRISYEEEYMLKMETNSYGGPISFFTSPMLLFGIPLAICEEPIPRFE